MKVVSILKGSTVQVAKPNKPFGFLPDMIQVVTEHFHFQEFPTDFSKLISHGSADAESPAVFRHGKVDIDGRSLVIDELHVYQNGTIVSMPASTKDSDLVTDYVFRWAGERFEMEFQLLGTRNHFSQLEVTFERPLAELFLPLKEIGTAINQGLDPSWKSMPPYELIDIHFGMDPLRAPQPNPGLFKIEARAQMPFDFGLYFCEAAMTTDAHVAILLRFEQICLERFAK